MQLTDESKTKHGDTAVSQNSAIHFLSLHGFLVQDTRVFEILSSQTTRILSPILEVHF